MGSMSGNQAELDPLAQKQADIAAAEWQRYKTDFMPTEKKFLGQLKEVGSQRESNFLGGMAEAGRQQQLGQAPNTGRAGDAIKRALSTETSMLPSENLLRSKQRQSKGLQSAVEMGRGIGTGSLNRIGRHAQIGTSRAISQAEAIGTKQAAAANALGTAAGYGLSKYNPDWTKPAQQPKAPDTITIDGYPYDTGIRR